MAGQAKRAETKHTPGPWRIRKCGVEIGPGHNEYIVCSFDGYLITSASESYGNDKADAKLIAAAPRLAEALEGKAIPAALDALDSVLRDIARLAPGLQPSEGHQRFLRNILDAARREHEEGRTSLRAAGRLP